MMSLEQWDAWIREKPDYFTAVVFKGRGCFDRQEANDLTTVRLKAKEMAGRSSRPAGIYAVRVNHQSHIENVTA